VGQARQACPALALKQSVLLGSPEKKVSQLGINLPPKQTLQLVQWTIAVVYLMKARLGFA